MPLLDVNQAVAFMIFDRRSDQDASLSHTRRGAHRHPVTIASKLTSSWLGNLTIEVIDLSYLGCRVALRFSLPVGEILTITLPTLAPLSARVIWTDGLSSGLAFTRPLGEPVLRMMAERHNRDGVIAV